MIQAPSSDALQVMLLQETRMSDSELAAYIRFARKKGYHVFYTQGHPFRDRWGSLRPLGGVICLIDQRLAFSGFISKASALSQFVGVWVEDWFLGSFYCPPASDGSRHDPEAECCEILNEIHLQTNCFEAGKWIIGGDANASPNTSTVAALLQAYGATILSQGSPTRWEGNREIDWLASNTAHEVISRPRLMSMHVSDHIPLHAIISSSKTLTPIGFLQSGPDWSMPPQLSRGIWKDLLQQCWDSCPVSPEQVFHDSIDVETDWVVFNQILDKLFRDAFQSMTSWHQYPDLVAVAHRRLRQKGLKGVRVCHKERFASRCKRITGNGCMSINKKRKRVARLYELKRQLVVASCQCNDVTAASNAPVCSSLISRLKLGEEGWSIVHVVNQLSTAKDDLIRSEAQFRSERLTAWKQKFVGQTKFASAWLHSRNSPGQVCIAEDDGSLGDHSTAVGAIRNYWNTFWREAKTSSPPDADITATLIEHTTDFPVTDLMPSADDLANIASAMRGSGGADGWRGDDISVLPRDFWPIFHFVVSRWLQAGQVPEVVLQARTVFIPKPHKVKEGRIKPADVRPITVCAAWWRVFSSAVLHTENAKQWVRAVLDEDIVYGQNSDAQVSAARLLHEFSRKGFVATLDYQKCFDLLRPQACAAILRVAGMPEDMVALCEFFWTRTRRWLCWNHHVESKPMDSQGMAIPQGEPFGPLLCGLWLSSGVRWIRSRNQLSQQQYQASIFVDDRTFACDSASTLIHLIGEWAVWSQLVGLKESTAKTQVTAKSEKQKRELVGLCDPNIQYSDATFLGVTTRGKPRKNSTKETERLSAAFRVLSLLGTLKLPYAVFSSYARLFGVSLVSYGWLARLPTQKDSKLLWSALKRGQRTGRMANSWIRSIIFGGLHHLDCVTAVQLFRVVANLAQKRLVHWRSSAGCPVHSLRKWLRDRGWREIGEWAWEHTSGLLTINFADPGFDVKHASHTLRDGWKLWCWDKFLNADRHEAPQLAQCSGQEILKVNFKKIREFISVDAAARSVATLATVSPAWFHDREHARSSKCLWCNELGHWEHLCWLCPSSPLIHLRPVYPSSPLIRRLGWTDGDLSILRYLSLVQKSIWEHEYGVT